MRTRALATMAVLAVAVGSWAAIPPGAAQADTAPTPVTPTDPVTVSADALPTVQVNGVVWSQVVVGSTVYAAGSFSSARPAGSPAGTNETPRGNLLAFDIRTGELIRSFAPSLNAQARTVAASPDGTRLYVGGDFTVADGQPRNRIAAYDVATGALVAGFRPSVGSPVLALAATNTTVYLGGSFSSVGGVSRSRLAAVRASDGGLLPWAPVPGPGPTTGNTLPLFDSNGNPIPGTRSGYNDQVSTDVLALVVTGGGTQVVAGGRFNSMNGARATGVAAIDAATGANRPFAINQVMTNQGVNSAVRSLATDGTNVYGSNYDYYGPGNTEGTWAATVAGGSIKWVSDCRGDTYSVWPMNGALYSASHAHNCANIGGFPEQIDRVWKRATAASLTAVGRVGPTTPNNANFVGTPSPALLNWFPAFAQGTVTGQNQGGWTVTGNGQYLVYGGEFPRVNGTNQAGLVRFAVPALAPNKVGPAVTTGLTATTIPTGVRVSWQSASDQDNRLLTYRVYRDGAAEPVATFARSTVWWQSLPVAWVDQTATAGSHSYRVTVSDPMGNTATIGSGAGTSSGPVAARAYASAVQADGASDQWSFGERTGSRTADQAGVDDLVGTGGFGLGANGAIRDGNPAASFNGTNAGFSTRTPRAGLNTLSLEAWFSTSSTAGGKILGFGSSSTGLSNDYDRQVWLEPSGKLHWAVWPGTAYELVTPTSYNNGRWHQVVATIGPAGMQLFMDGRLVASRTDGNQAQVITGYWRIGGDRTWSGAPYFTGLIDEVAVYPVPLTAEQVARHYTIGTNGTVGNTAPTASFTAAVQTMTVSVDGQPSVDPDGPISGFAWDFGDGTTGTGATASRTYTRGGTYTVRLTVTDGAGATGTTERQVAVVEPPNEPPTSAFTSTSTGLSLAVDGRGSADPDGTVASYAWNWGDSTAPGTGATATHTYAAAGTYQVTLTVTDDDGATTALTRGMAVAAPGSTPPLAVDTFERSVTGGLGTAELGGPWTASAGATRQSVTGGAAVLTVNPGTNTGSYLGTVGRTDVDVRTTLSVSRVPTTGTGAYAYVTGRRVGADEYRARLRVLPDGSVGVALTRVVSGGETILGATTTLDGVSYAPDTPLEVRLQATGSGTTTLTLTVWPAGTAEPTTPTLVRTDTTAALQAAGGVGLAAYLSGSSTSPVMVRFDQLRVTVPGAEESPVPVPAANQEPVADFTATASGLAVAVDGSASADPDGQIAGYAWNWGDGTAAGSGRTASHTYATGGAYTVTLTVTDDDGATATATRPVTVSAPGGPTQPAPLAADAFERSVTGGLGVADLGGPWTVAVGAVRQSVADGTAVMNVGPGNNAGSFLGGVASTDVDVRTTVMVSRVPADGSGAYAYVTGRRVGANLEYRARLRVLTDGSVGVAVSRLAGGETLLGAVTTLPGFTYVPDTPLEVRVRVTGTGTTTVAVTVWPAGTPEPTAPTLVRTDSTPELQAPGGIGLAAYLSGSSTSPVTVRFDSLVVTEPQ